MSGPSLAGMLGLSVLAIALILGALAVGAIVLLLLGIRGRRLDDHPICRNCSFDLVGNADAPRCPECGADLTSARSIRHGHRRRRRLPLVLGTLCALLALAGVGVVVWTATTSFNWNTIKPTWMLVGQTSSGSQDAASGAIDELVVRLTNAQLDRETIGRVVAVALDRQADRESPWINAFGVFISEARMQGDVSDHDWKRYFRQSAVVDLVLRERVNARMPIDLKISARADRLDNTTQIVVAPTLQSVTVDGEPALDEIEGSMAMLGLAGGGSGTVTTGSFEFDEPGRKRVEMVWRLRVFEKFGDDQPLDEWTVTLTEDVEVIPHDEPIVRLTDDPELGAAIERAISVSALSVAPDEQGANLRANVDFKDLPVGIAMNVVARAPDGRDVPIGVVVVLARPGSHSWGLGSHLGSDEAASFLEAEKLDVVLTTNTEKASTTPGLDETWDGTIVLEGVPLGRKPPATPPNEDDG